jgi:hypothetical protein
MAVRSSSAAAALSDSRWPVLGLRRWSFLARATSSGRSSAWDLRPSHLPSRARLRSRAAFSLATGLLESGNCAEHLRDQVLYHAELPKPDETTEELVDGNSVGQAKALNQKDKSGLSHCPTAYGLGQWDGRYLLRPKPQFGVHN